MIKASPGQNPVLLQSGPFTFTGHCKDLGGGVTEAFMTLTTSQAGSSMSSYEDQYYEADFNPGTEAEIGYDVSGNTPETNEDGYGGYYTGYSAASADGKTLIRGEGASAVNYFGAPCAFWIDGTNAS